MLKSISFPLIVLGALMVQVAGPCGFAQEGSPPQSAPGGAATPQVQQVPPAPDGAEPEDGKAIRLDVVVTDKAGRLVTGLKASDFVLDDDNKPQAIKSFEAFGGPQDPSPAQIVMVIDRINVDFSKVAQERQQIDQFLRANSGKLSHPISIVWATEQGLQPQGPGSYDGNQLADQFDKSDSRLRFENRDAGLWGYVDEYTMSLNALDKLVSAVSATPGRKLLIWIGPGWPLLDSPSLQMSGKQQQDLFRRIIDMRTRLRKYEIPLYSVTEGMPNEYTYVYQAFLKGVKRMGDAYPANLDLKVLAVESGGRAESPNNDLKSEIGRCVADADAYYSISFDPPPAHEPNEYHDLKVKIADHPGLIARTDTGYYDQPANGIH